MRGFKFLIGLAVAVLIHALGVFFFDGFPRVVDVFLLVVIFNALDGNLLAAMLGGLAAGLVADTLGGGLYGLNGLADTIIGYGAAFTSQRLVIERATGVLLFFGLGASLQQAITAGLSLVLLREPSLPDAMTVALKIAATAAVGMIGYFGHRRFVSGLASWRRNRRTRLTIQE